VLVQSASSTSQTSPQATWPASTRRIRLAPEVRHVRGEFAPKAVRTIQLNAFSSIIAQTRPGDDGGLGRGGGASAAYDDVCYDVALIREHQATTKGGTSILPVAEQRITACSSDAQEDERTVFTSTSHVVDIVFTARNEPSRGPHFILGFTGKRHVSNPV
jgi:hypothetical protein